MPWYGPPYSRGANKNCGCCPKIDPCTDYEDDFTQADGTPPNPDWWEVSDASVTALGNAIVIPNGQFMKTKGPVSQSPLWRIIFNLDLTVADSLEITDGKGKWLLFADTSGLYLRIGNINQRIPVSVTAEMELSFIRDDLLEEPNYSISKIEIKQGPTVFYWEVVSRRSLASEHFQFTATAGNPEMTYVRYERMKWEGTTGNGECYEVLPGDVKTCEFCFGAIDQLAPASFTVDLAGVVTGGGICPDCDQVNGTYLLTNISSCQYEFDSTATCYPGRFQIILEFSDNNDNQGYRINICAQESDLNFGNTAVYEIPSANIPPLKFCNAVGLDLPILDGVNYCGVDNGTCDFTASTVALTANY